MASEETPAGPAPDDGAELSRAERMAARSERVRREYEAKFAWGREMLVLDPKTGELDDERTQKVIPYHDVTAATAIRERYGDTYFVVPDAAQTSVFRLWDGQIWRVDLGEGNAHALIQDFWDQMGYALDQIKEKIRLSAEKKVAR